MSNPKIFISYSWSDTAVVDKIDNFFQSIGYKLTRDIRELHYKDSIRQYMKQVRENDKVIMVISQQFLKSVNCMFEVLEFMKDDNYRDRILPILHKDTDIFNPEEGLLYVDYWNDKYTNLRNELNKRDPLDVTSYFDELRTLEQIKRTIAEFISVIKSMKIVRHEELERNNYAEILAHAKLGNHDSMLKLVKLYNTKDPEEQDLLLEEILNEYPKMREAMFLKALFSQLNNDLKKAKKHYEDFLQEYPEDSNGHNNYAQLICGSPFYQLDEAEQHFIKALNLNGEDEELPYNYANFLVNINNVNKAKQYFGKALQINPLYVEALNNLATIYFDIESIDKSKLLYERVLALNPLLKEANYNYANLLMKLKNYRDAIKYYDKVLLIDRNNHEVLNQIGNSYAELKEYKKAKEYYIKALKFAPNNSDYLVNLGLILLNYTRDIKAAKSSFKKALKFNPTSMEACANLAELLRNNLGDTKAARKLYEDFLKKQLDGSIYNNLAILLYTQFGDSSLARENFEKAIRLESKNINIKHNFAVFLSEIDKGLAIQICVEILHDAPDHQPTRVLLHSNLREGDLLLPDGQIINIVDRFTEEEKDYILDEWSQLLNGGS